MSGIDDPIEAVKQQYPEGPASPISVMLEVLSPMHPFLGLVNVFRQFASKSETNSRVRALFEAFEWHVREQGKQIEELALEKQLELPQAKEAVITAVTEAILSPDINKIKRFAAILGHEFVGKGNKTSWESAATYIRALTQLGDDDMQTLRILYKFQSGAFLAQDKPDEPQFRRTMERVRIELEQGGMPREDVYSRCARLNGFGLTLQMERPKGMAEDYIYRLTRHGKHLIDMLQGVP